MRLIISLALVACATTLLCHGLFTNTAAEAALAAATDVPALRKVMRDHPYGLAAVEAGRRRLELLQKAPPPEGDHSFLPRAWEMVNDGVRDDQAPWVLPPSAGAIGLAALLLAVLLPGTRFRGLALMVLLAGVVALFPAYSAPSAQLEYAETLSVTTEAVAWNPFISSGLMVMGALLLGGKRRRED